MKSLIFKLIVLGTSMSFGFVLGMVYTFVGVLGSV